MNAKGAGLIALLLLVRAVFLLLGGAALGGDGMGYVVSAQEIVRNGAMPPAAWQPLGFTVVMLVPIIWLLGGDTATVDYLAKPYPGYPGIIGDPIAGALFPIHVAMDLIVVAILIAEARRLLAGRGLERLALAATVFLALQPFTAAMANFVYPDHGALFCFFTGGYLVTRYFRDGGPTAPLAAGAGLMGLAAVIRLDMLPVAAAVLGLMLLLGLKTEGLRRGLAAMVIAGLCFLAPSGGMLAFQYKSTGEIGWANMTSSPDRPDVKRGGYFAWVRTWIMFVQGESNVFGTGDWGGSKTWAGYDIDQFPGRAFRNPQERAEVAGLVTAWRDGGYSPAIDAGFRRIADARKRENPLWCFVLVPSVRMVHYWVNLEGARPIQATLGLNQTWSRVATALVFPFRLLFLALAAVGVYAVWVKRRAGILSWDDGFAFARVCTLMIVVRTLEFGILGTFIVSGLVETRYVIVAMPAMLMLSVVGLWWLGAGDRRGMTAMQPALT